MDIFIATLPQQIINGLTLGAVYALIALGYSMVYGVLQLLNFAHGDVYMVGAFIGYGVMMAFIPESGPLFAPVIIIILMLLVAMLGCGVLGIVIEQFAYRPLRNSPRIAPLISALGVSFFIQNAIQLTLTAQFRNYETEKLIAPAAGIDLGFARLSATRALVIVTAIVLMIVLQYLIKRTRLGKAMRAVAIDREAAAMMGVNVDRVIIFTFFIGSALAGAAGVLTGIVFTRVWHFMGFAAGLKGFTAAVLGGIGNIPGAMLGGFILGLAETFAVGFISATYKDVVAFVVLIIVLLLRPRGLLGARIPQKV
ncbi:MAG: branched-chain amino acid ABC transporter permease [Anaerolineae bacterium]|nr:branched-chain amino acid ABC transporter permease [Anaerolineae bacterium]MBN8617792.1 branched-chain amino acid ABC transporter permease [Anaerolineae bacterium]